MLRVWDPTRPTPLTTDASGAGAGVPPHLLELLAVVDCLNSFRPYLLDRTFDSSFELRTDNASLQWFLQQRSLSHHQARWLNTISEFKFTA